MSGIASQHSRHRAGSGSHHSALSSNRGRTGEMGDFAMQPPQLPRYFEPCAATAAMFLYAQGPSVVCCHHDTLTIERRFARHSHEVQLLAVDNSSERGAGRLVVSYDAGQNAIVWDLMTGDEISRFASYDHITAAAWMRSGNVAFGNSQGTIILFEPRTQEHVSARTIDQIAVTALAPSGDCRTFAIGYQNGQCLVAVLQPRFTILHNLTMSRSPSPIVTLQWHASSSRQKSDMLASQTQEGDLKVWSVAKSYDANEPAKVVRSLKRTEIFRPGPNWMAWSKNGRIIQYSEMETISWDVRTKHVTHDMIPTLEHVRGLAVYGPGASLFTLGANNTVQQFDLNAPAIMVANVQHPANLLPPSPPVSLENDKATTIASESEITFNPSDVGISESDDDYSRPNFSQDESGQDAYGGGSMRSSQGEYSTVSGSRTPNQYGGGSVRSRGMTEHTYISAGESTRSKQKRGFKSSDLYSQCSFSSISTKSNVRPSRLRNEVRQEKAPSVEETKVDDLFSYTRSRLSDVPHKSPFPAEAARLTNDDLRRQMLSTIFGWDKEIEDLIADEMSRHPNGSSSRIMLAKWLGYIDQDFVASGAESMTSSDWMLLALSGIGGQQSSQHKIGRAYVTTLLEKRDVHAAATILIGMGDHNDAIEVYNSHKRYMEALIVTCLFFPSVWERQCAIVKRWGEWAIHHGHRDLAIRCFACSGQESTEPWASPSAAQLTFQNMGPSISEVLSPPLSPPAVNRGPQRQLGKHSALKLITSFGDHGGKAKFFSQADDGQTPIAGRATPIAQSAIDMDPQTAVMLGNRSAFPTSGSVKSFASSTYSRGGPLPSIGEANGDVSAGGFGRADGERNMAESSIIRAKTASPPSMRDGFRGNHEDIPPPHSSMSQRVEQSMSNRRNASRGRIPPALNLHTEEHSSNQSKYHWPRRRGPASVSSVTSASTTATRSTRGGASRHLDNYIHSLDAASDYSKKMEGREASRDRRAAHRDQSQDRGRTPVQGYPAKRSPTSPVPMSPEEIVVLSSAKYTEGTPAAADPVGHRKASNKSRASQKGGSRRGSPERRPSGHELRSRTPGILSPTSPQPMSAMPQLDDTEDEEDYRKALEAQEKFRQKHSTSRGLATPTTGNSMRQQERSRSRSRRENSGSRPQPYLRGGSVEHMGDLKAIKQERQRRKEQAARELEERRRELSRNSQAGSITHPSDILPANRFTAVEMSSSAIHSPPRAKTADPFQNSYGRGRLGAPQIGLPATPKAMRLVIDSDHSKGSAPAVPPIPQSYAPAKAEEDYHAPASRESPKKEPEGLTLLPSTVYQPPRGPIPRSMSAPIPDEPMGRGHRSNGSRSGGLARNQSVRSKGGDLHGINETQDVRSFSRRESRDLEQPPPPPPAAPMPVLKELQHLAMPPPPPPAPLPFATQQQPVSALASGMIEIVMDEDDQAPAPMTQGPTPIHVPPTEITVPIISPPAPPSAKGHSRGRSITDSSSLAGRISKATERLRSASKTRKDSGLRGQKSPEFAPYESIQPPAGLYTQMGMRSPPIDPSTLPTGLNRNEMI
ncbi:hypothetical protein jhhlp_004367 [Lomentospora prolificans]|uniref:Gem-associated protein 5 TPR domain-containing protein n=1 Tax=Lomentospora prolificans TaxID=41688 RepID=A0A2N3NBC5_9PEZI|nr:hypothetical protein jhhlp_004367 [Lomentospora prolificans]